MKTEAYEKVKTARSNSRPTSMDYIRHIFDVFLELHGDRNSRMMEQLSAGSEF